VVEGQAARAIEDACSTGRAPGQDERSGIKN
jgi:hypothetical protein